MAAPRITDEDLSKMAVAGINFAPSADAAPGTLQVQVRTEQPLMVIGSVDNTDVRRVRTNGAAKGERFNPALRLVGLDARNTRSAVEQVRGALWGPAGKEQNAGVPWKAWYARAD